MHVSRFNLKLYVPYKKAYIFQKQILIFRSEVILWTTMQYNVDLLFKQISNVPNVLQWCNISPLFL